MKSPYLHALFACCFALAGAGEAGAATLPLSLKLWSLSASKTVVCTGKAWVPVAAGTLARRAVIVVLADGNPSHDDSLLACDDGAGADAPITGDMTATRPIAAGQTVAQGKLQIIFLNVPAAAGTHVSIAFDVNSLDGEVVLASRTGKGMIRISRAKGMDVYPPSFAVDSVDQSTEYRLQQPAPAPTPCVVSYYAGDPNVPQKVLHSNLDCVTLLHQAGTDAIFSATLPQQ